MHTNASTRIGCRSPMKRSNHAQWRVSKIAVLVTERKESNVSPVGSRANESCLRTLRPPWPTVKTLESALSFSCYLSLFGTETPPKSHPKDMVRISLIPLESAPLPTCVVTGVRPTLTVSTTAREKFARGSQNPDVQALKNYKNFRPVIFR